MGSPIGMGNRIMISNELARGTKAFNSYDKLLADKGLSKENVLDALKAFEEGAALYADVSKRLLNAVLQELAALNKFAAKHHDFFEKDPQAHAEIKQVLQRISAAVYSVEEIKQNLRRETEGLKRVA